MMIVNRTFAGAKPQSPYGDTIDVARLRQAFESMVVGMATTAVTMDQITSAQITPALHLSAARGTHRPLTVQAGSRR